MKAGGAARTPYARPVRPLACLAFAALVPVAASCGGDAKRPIAARVPLAAGPVDLAVVDGRVWTTVPDLDRVLVVDPDSRRVVARYVVGRTPLRLAREPRGVWVSEFRAGTVALLARRGGRVLQRVRVGDQPEGLAYADGALWVVLQADAQLARVEGGRITRRVDLPPEPRLVTAGAGALWATSFLGGTVTRVVPRSGGGRSFRVCAGPQGVLVAGGRVWVACTTEGLVVSLDATTGRIRTRTKLPAPDGLAALGDGRVGVALQEGPALAVLDAETGRVLRRGAVDRAGALSDANVEVERIRDEAWSSSFDGRKLVVVDPDALAAP
jgi:outer membrane protein assembly factor BamB